MDFTHLTAKDLITSYWRFEKHHVPNVYFRLLIPNNRVGPLVGDHGHRIRNIGKDNNAFVSVEKFKLRQDYRSCLRVLIIRGQPADCVSACMQCLNVILEDENPNGQFTGKLSLDFVLPDTLIQYMEEGGDSQDKQDVFELMAEKTKTRIQVSDKCLPYSTERVVRISVRSIKHSANLHQAVGLMAEQLHENITLYMCSPHNSFYVLEEPGHTIFQQQLDTLFNGEGKSYCFYQ